MNPSRDIMECFEAWKEKNFPKADPGMTDAIYDAWTDGWYAGKEDSMNYTIVTSAMTKLTDEERASLDD